MSNNYSIGSIWRKWDLHIHTPLSHTTNYGAPSEAWEKFIADLEALPEEFKVIGINDYIFLDGYKKVLEYKQNGRLPKIDLILPVLEFRLKEFVGHEHLKRINYHIVFADESVLSATVIQQQFLSRFTGAAKLDSNITGVTWGGVVTRDSLTDLGKRIRQSTPEAKRTALPGDDFELGFNNINFEISALEESLGERGNPNTYLKDRYLKFIGKSEWEDFRWDGGSIADKKSIINGSHFVFAASETIESACKSKQKLAEQEVNSRLLHCSDAHNLSGCTTSHLKIGSCFSWIKADTTFEGLKQVLNEVEDRTYIGSLPPSKQRVAAQPTRVVQSVEIRKSPGATTQEKWFDQVLVLNPELIAVIGNKGSGKSALADILGLLGNTPRYDSFSFLRNDRFRAPKDNKAKQFQAAIKWADGAVEPFVALDSNPNPEDVEKIKYIPQNYLEEICNEVGLGKESRFYAELQQVIFSHVSEPERLGFETLDQLLEHRSQETKQAIDILVSELSAINKQIVDYENRLSPHYKKAIELQLVERKRELDANEQAKPKAVPKPEEDPITQQQSKLIAEKLEEKKTRLSEVEKKIGEIEKEDTALVQRKTLAEKLIGRLQNIQRMVGTSLEESKKDFSSLGLKVEEVVSLKVATTPIQIIIDNIDARRLTLKNALDKDVNDSIEKSRRSLEDEIKQLKSKLSAPQQAYQAYLQKLKEWDLARKKIIGAAELPNSMEYLKLQLAEVERLPSLIQGFDRKRNRKILEIYREKRKLRQYYEIYYGKVQEFLNTHALISTESIKLTFNVSMTQSGFADGFLTYINQRKVGPFAGLEEGGAELKRLLAMVNWDSAKDVLKFARNVLRKMTVYDDKRLEIKDQLKQGVELSDFYDYLFSLRYASPIYRLKWDGKTLEQLSPGERGNLLLIFYLLVDRDTIPLVIDQPEENLDNHTVYKVLVPCIKDAKKRRQIIMVTHNPNLAVVCDAEQIICAEMFKERMNEVVYSCGSIENPVINKKIVDVLEGTRPAFDKRDAKYQK